MKLAVLLFTLFISLLLGSAAYSQEDALAEPVKQLKHLAKRPNILNLVRAEDGRLDIDQLIAQDEHWANSPGKRLVLLNLKMQHFFKQLLDKSDSQIVEILLLGSQGETLAAYPLPNDYWHGNTPKFINVMADENVFVDELSWDKHTRHIQARISVPIKDDKNEMFGVLTAKVSTHLASNN